MFRRPLGLFSLGALLFAVAILVAGGLGWVTVSSLRVEDEQRLAESLAQQNEKERLALWRLDSRVYISLGLEGYRKYEDYTALYTPPGEAPGCTSYLSRLVVADIPDWMRLHVQLDPATGWTSPEVLPTGTVSQLSNSNPELKLFNLTDENRDRLAEWTRRMPVTHAFAALRNSDSDLPDSSAIMVSSVESNAEMKTQGARDQKQPPGFAETLPSPALAQGNSRGSPGGRSAINPTQSPFLGNTTLPNGPATQNGLQNNGMPQGGGRGIPTDNSLSNDSINRTKTNDQLLDQYQKGLGTLQEVKNPKSKGTNPAEMNKVVPAPESESNQDVTKKAPPADDKKMAEMIRPSSSVPSKNESVPLTGATTAPAMKPSSAPAPMPTAGAGLAAPMPPPRPGEVTPFTENERFENRKGAVIPNGPGGLPGGGPAGFGGPGQGGGGGGFGGAMGGMGGSPGLPSPKNFGGGGGGGRGGMAAPGAAGLVDPRNQTSGIAIAGGAGVVATNRVPSDAPQKGGMAKFDRIPKPTPAPESPSPASGVSEPPAPGVRRTATMNKPQAALPSPQQTQTVPPSPSAMSKQTSRGDASKERSLAAESNEDKKKQDDAAKTKNLGMVKNHPDTANEPLIPPATQKPAPSVPAMPVDLGPMRPKWVKDVEGNWVLFVFRPARLESKVVYQGIWIDWEKLRTLLQDEYIEDFPDGSLVPTLETVEAPQHQLASLPVQFDAGPMSVPPPVGWTPLRMGLGLAWLAAAISLIAVWFGGRSLVDLSERRIRFVSAVTHELRTPLTSLRLYLDMLTSGMITDEGQKQQYLTTLSHESNRLHQLIENVLDFAKLEKRAATLAAVPVSVTELCTPIRETWEERLAADGKELVVVSTVPPDQIVVVDPRIAQQILGNLIDNARKYTPGVVDPRIWLWIKPAGRMVAFEVEDRGPGIPVTERRSIFRPFHRGGSSGATGGAGLGLALARQWAETSGGRLTYHPSPSGTGSCFRLELPT